MELPLSKIVLTRFRSIKETSIEDLVEFSSWDDYVEWLRELSHKPSIKPKDEKDILNPKAAKLITPAIFKPKTKRGNVNVLGWGGWAAVDIDEKLSNSNLDTLFQRIKPYNYVMYSSASSRKSHPKFRIVFELEGWIKAEKIKPFWQALNAECLGIVDAQTKDLCRMYYSPGQYEKAFNFFYTNKALPMNPFELIEKHGTLSFRKQLSDRLGKQMQNKIKQQRLQELIGQKKHYSWTNYADCPFVKQEHLDQWNSITETGWYHLSFKMMCSIASRAFFMKYPLTAQELAQIVKEIDDSTIQRYTNRNWEKEANRAIDYVLSNKKVDNEEEIW